MSDIIKQLNVIVTKTSSAKDMRVNYTAMIRIDNNITFSESSFDVKTAFNQLVNKIITECDKMKNVDENFLNAEGCHYKKVTKELYDYFY